MAKPDYIAFTFEGISDIEVLTALLDAEGFEAFWEEDDRLIGYISDTNMEEVSAHLREMYGHLFNHVTTEIIPYTNWNKDWESHFEPVRVGDFCFVRALFHPSEPGYEHELVIQPQMAFGTGHHETTYMMIEAMQAIDFKNKTVLDYGAGTGILAILAVQLGAAHVVANEIDLNVLENTHQNMDQNNVSVDVIGGDLTQVPATIMFDIVLANINRNVLLSSFESLHKRMKKGGQLILSGILKADEEIITVAANQYGFKRYNQRLQSNWLCQQYTLE